MTALACSLGKVAGYGSTAEPGCANNTPAKKALLERRSRHHSYLSLRVMLKLYRSPMQKWVTGDTSLVTCPPMPYDPENYFS